MYKKWFSTLAVCACFLVSVPAAMAAEEGLEPQHKLLIQVNTDDVKTQEMALNNAMNAQKVFGMDNIAIEIVAYGPGLSLVSGKTAASERVPSLAQQNIQFTACGNTINKITEKTGKAPVLVEGVKVVPAGVVRIVELQEQGYSYLRP